MVICLYLAPGTGVPVRIHGAFIADEEVHRVVCDWKRRGRPDYLEDVLSLAGGEAGFGELSQSEEDAEQDSLYDQAVQIVLETRRASVSNIRSALKLDIIVLLAFGRVYGDGGLSQCDGTKWLKRDISSCES